MGGKHVPEALQWVFLLLGGARWPEGDEDALGRVAKAHHDEATAARAYAQELKQAQGMVGEAIQGGASQAMIAALQGMITAAEEHAAQQDNSARSCENTARDIDYTKDMIIVSLGILAFTIIQALASEVVTLGVSTAEIPIAIAATRIAVMTLLRSLLKKLAQQGLKEIAVDVVKVAGKDSVKMLAKDAMKEAGRQAAVKAEKQAAKSVLRKGAEWTGKEAAKQGVQGAAQDVGIQAWQTAEGKRDGVDWKEAGKSGLQGAVGGVVGGAVTHGAGHIPGLKIPEEGGSGLANFTKGQLAGFAGNTAGAGAGAAASGDLNQLGKLDTWIGGAGAGLAHGTAKAAGDAVKSRGEPAGPAAPSGGPAPAHEAQAPHAEAETLPAEAPAPHTQAPTAHDAAAPSASLSHDSSGAGLSHDASHGAPAAAAHDSAAPQAGAHHDGGQQPAAGEHVTATSSPAAHDALPAHEALPAHDAPVTPAPQDAPATHDGGGSQGTHLLGGEQPVSSSPHTGGVAHTPGENPVHGGSETRPTPTEATTQSRPDQGAQPHSSPESRSTEPASRGREPQPAVDHTQSQSEHTQLHDRPAQEHLPQGERARGATDVQSGSAAPVMDRPVDNRSTVKPDDPARAQGDSRSAQAPSIGGSAPNSASPHSGAESSRPARSGSAPAEPRRSEPTSAAPREKAEPKPTEPKREEPKIQGKSDAQQEQERAAKAKMDANPMARDAGLGYNDKLIADYVHDVGGPSELNDMDRTVQDHTQAVLDLERDPEFAAAEKGQFAPLDASRAATAVAQHTAVEAKRALASAEDKIKAVEQDLKTAERRVEELKNKGHGEGSEDLRKAQHDVETMDKDLKAEQVAREKAETALHNAEAAHKEAVQHTEELHQGYLDLRNSEPMQELAKAKIDQIDSNFDKLMEHLAEIRKETEPIKKLATDADHREREAYDRAKEAKDTAKKAQGAHDDAVREHAPHEEQERLRREAEHARDAADQAKDAHQRAREDAKSLRAAAVEAQTREWRALGKEPAEARDLASRSYATGSLEQLKSMRTGILKEPKFDKVSADRRIATPELAAAKLGILPRVNDGFKHAVPGSMTNCSGCAVAGEGTRRGFPMGAPLTLDRGAGLGFHDIEKIGGGKMEPTDFEGVADRLEAAGPGASALVAFIRSPEQGGGGHIFRMENVDGKIQIQELQNQPNAHSWPQDGTHPNNMDKYPNYIQEHFAGNAPADIRAIHISPGGVPEKPLHAEHEQPTAHAPAELKSGHDVTGAGVAHLPGEPHQPSHGLEHLPHEDRAKAQAALHKAGVDPANLHKLDMMERIKAEHQLRAAGLDPAHVLPHNEAPAERSSFADRVAAHQEQEEHARQAQEKTDAARRTADELIKNAQREHDERFAAQQHPDHATAPDSAGGNHQDQAGQHRDQAGHHQERADHHHTQVDEHRRQAEHHKQEADGHRRGFDEHRRQFDHHDQESRQHKSQFDQHQQQAVQHHQLMQQSLARHDYQTARHHEQELLRHQAAAMSHQKLGVGHQQQANAHKQRAIQHQEQGVGHQQQTERHQLEMTRNQALVDQHQAGAQHHQQQADHHREQAEREQAEREQAEREVLTHEDKEALHDYTGPHYSELNGACRGKIDMTPELQARVDAVSDALHKLPPYEGVVYRGTWLRPEVLANFHEGHVIRDEGFTSTSTKPEKADQFLTNSMRPYGDTVREPVRMIIETAHGRDISEFSQNKGEREILLDRRAQLKIISAERHPDGHWEVKLKEVSDSEHAAGAGEELSAAPRHDAEPEDAAHRDPADTAAQQQGTLRDRMTPDVFTHGLGVLGDVQHFEAGRTPEEWLHAAVPEHPGENQGMKGTRCALDNMAVVANSYGHGISAPSVDPHHQGTSGRDIESWAGSQFRESSMGHVKDTLDRLPPGSTAIIGVHQTNGAVHMMVAKKIAHEDGPLGPWHEVVFMDATHAYDKGFGEKGPYHDSQIPVGDGFPLKERNIDQVGAIFLDEHGRPVPDEKLIAPGASGMKINFGVDLDAHGNPIPFSHEPELPKKLDWADKNFTGFEPPSIFESGHAPDHDVHPDGSHPPGEGPHGPPEQARREAVENALAASDGGRLHSADHFLSQEHLHDHPNVQTQIHDTLHDHAFKASHPEVMAHINEHYGGDPVRYVQEKMQHIGDLPKDVLPDLAHVMDEHERQFIHDLRHSIEMPKNDTVMQKIIPIDRVAGYFQYHDFLGRDSESQKFFDRTTGYVSVAADTAHLDTPKKINDGDRLDYAPGSGAPNPYQDYSKPFFAVRFEADSNKVEIPDRGLAESINRSGGYETDDHPPCTRTGFLASRDGTGINPEYHAGKPEEALAKYKRGATMWAINPEGVTPREVLIGVYLGKGDWVEVKPGSYDEVVRAAEKHASKTTVEGSGIGDVETD